MASLEDVQSKLQEKHSALKREHAVIKKMKFINFFLFLWVTFAQSFSAYYFL
jgi:hypothetical protein